MKRLANCILGSSHSYDKFESSHKLFAFALSIRLSVYGFPISIYVQNFYQTLKLGATAGDLSLTFFVELIAKLNFTLDSSQASLGRALAYWSSRLRIRVTG